MKSGITTTADVWEPTESEKARQDQINAKVDDDLRRQAESAAEVGGDESSATVIVEDQPETFPNDLAESIKILQERVHEVEIVPAKRSHRVQLARATKRLAAIQKHVWNLQQTPAAPDVASVAQAQRHSDLATLTEGPARRLASLKQLDAMAATLEAVKVNASDESVVESHLTLATSPKNRLLTHPRIKLSLAVCKMFLLLWAKRKLDLFDQIAPESRAKELTRDLAETNNADVIAAIQARLSAYGRKNESADIAARFNRELTAQFGSFEASFRTLLSQSIEALRSGREEARQAEVAWLAAFGLPHEATALSRRYSEVIGYLEGLQSRGVNKDSLVWFGVPALPPLA